MAIPAKTSLHMVSTLMCPSGDNVLDCPRKYVPIMRHARSKWRTIIEGISRICEINMLLYVYLHKEVLTRDNKDHMNIIIIGRCHS